MGLPGSRGSHQVRFIKDMDGKFISTKIEMRKFVHVCSLCLTENEEKCPSPLSSQNRNGWKAFTARLKPANINS